MLRLALLLFFAPLTCYAGGVDGIATEAVISSAKVVTMQESVSADKVANSKIQSAEAAASTAVDLYNREQVRQIWDDYGTDSQLVDGCYQVGLADTASQIKSKTDASAASAASLVYKVSDDGTMAAPGITGVFGGRVQKSFFPYTASVESRVRRHQQKYCSVSEAALGYCTLLPNGMQSGDSDFSLLYAPGQTYGWDQAEASSDFVKTVAPVKPMPATQGECDTEACKSVLNERREQEPYLSMARFSFLNLFESRSTQASGDAKQAVSK